MTFKKADTGKPRFSLLPPGPILELVKVLSFGAAKYGADNWRTAKPEDLARYKDALGRHLNAYAAGEALDAESGLPHLAHALCNIVFLMELEGTREKVENPIIKSSPTCNLGTVGCHRNPDPETHYFSENCCLTGFQSNGYGACRTCRCTENAHVK